MQHHTPGRSGADTGAGWSPPAGIVLVPTDGPWRPGDGGPRVRIGQAPDGAPVALAYSSPAALTEVHGEHPWVAVQRADLLQALRPLGVERFLIDGRPVRADD
jgi:hypothetical protein